MAEPAPEQRETAAVAGARLDAHADRMPYQYLTCYFLSGTGNSYRAAQWLAQAAGLRGVEPRVVPIDRARPAQELRSGPEQLVGLYHPAHGLMPPWSMIKYLLRMPWGRGAHAVVVATRGGIRMGRLVIPGATGWALLFPALVLALKGYRVRGGLGIDMPINLINLHWGLAPHNIELIKAWGRRRHERLVNAVLGGRRFWSPLNLVWETLWAVVPLLWWPLFPLIYLLVGRVFMAKLMFADTRCRGCGVCSRSCPNGGITMVGRKPKVPFWTYHCEVCLRCMGFCKFQAVAVSHLWIAPVVFLTSLLGAAELQRGLGWLLGQQVGLWPIAFELGSYALTAVALLLLYYVLWGLLRIRPLHVALSYLTLTRYYRRRYHEPETKLKDLRAGTPSPAKDGAQRG